MAKRIVEYVGIGDVNPTSTLEIAPIHGDDVGVIIRGTNRGSQTANLFEIRDNSNTLVAYIDTAGAFFATVFSASTAIVVSASTLSATTMEATTVCATTVTATNISGTTVYATTLTATNLTATNIAFGTAAACACLSAQIMIPIKDKSGTTYYVLCLSAA